MDTIGRSHMLISSGCKRVKSYYLEPFWFEKTAYRDFESTMRDLKCICLEWITEKVT